MSLSRNHFNVLVDSHLNGPRSQRVIAEAKGMSLGSVNAAIASLKEAQLLDERGSITEEGIAALEPHRVENAIIMAAGSSTRFAPLSYERPKGVLRVKGEALIERQIRQLQEAGIDDITVVIGYMKEQFFYLEDKLGVKLLVNEVYDRRNNNSTLMLVREKLGNTFICSSDNYFTQNVFEPYVHSAYYAATYFEGETEEYMLHTGAGGRIDKVTIGGSDGYAMLGHAYFDKDFSQRFVQILEEEYDLPETAPKLWEDIYRDHIAELPMIMRPYDPGIVYEFDSLEELRRFDPDFIENVDSSILDNICATLSVPRSDVLDILPISQGLTNLSCRFTVNGKNYVYRHPGRGTDAIIDRSAEALSQGIAHELGLDGTFIYEDPKEGWKVSRFLDGCQELDYHDAQHVSEAMRLIRTLHESGRQSSFTFDLHEKTLELIGLLGESHRASFPDFTQLYEDVEEVAAYLQAEAVPPVLCHNDFYSPNLLVADGRMHLIDWEYSGMSDYASDLGTFICCSDYDYDEALGVLEGYFQRPLTEEELIHCVSYVALAAYYWFVWALYKDACGAPTGEWLYLWYKAAKSYSAKALELIAQKRSVANV